MKWLLLVLCLGLFLRITGVETVPSGMSHDELDMVNNGYAIIQTGNDLFGERLPLTTGGTGLVVAPAIIAGIGATIFGLTPLGVRILPVLLGTINIYLVYKIAYLLTGSKRSGILSALLLAISPWGIHFSRMMYDPPIAFFFMLFGIERFLSAEQKSTYMLATVFLGLGLISYYGFLFVIPPLLILLFCYRSKDLVKMRTTSFWIVAISMIFVATLVLMISRQGHNDLSGARRSEIIFSQQSRISNTVDLARQQTLNSLMDRLFINKSTVIFTETMGNYLSAFNPEILFSFGEASEILSLRQWGFLYLLDLPLIIIGGYQLYKKRRKEALLLFGFVIISPFTVAISDRTYVARAALLFPTLLVFAGYGAYKVLSGLSKTPAVLPRFLVIMFSFAYVFSVLGFLYQYHVRYPVYAKEIWFDSEKQVSQFIIDNPAKLTVVSTPEVKDTFMQYFFYGHLDPVQSQIALSTYKAANMILYDEQVLFMGCIDPKEKKDGEVLLIVDHVCGDISESDEYIYSREGANNKLWGIYK